MSFEDIEVALVVYVFSKGEMENKTYISQKKSLIGSILKNVQSD